MKKRVARIEVTPHEYWLLQNPVLPDRKRTEQEGWNLVERILNTLSERSFSVTVLGWEEGEEEYEPQSPLVSAPACIATWDH